MESPALAIHQGAFWALQKAVKRNRLLAATDDGAGSAPS
jgi:hypothetical protein